MAEHTFVPPAAGSRGALKRVSRWLSHGDRPYAGLVAVSALTVLAIAAGIGAELWSNSAQSRDTFGWAFLWTRRWNPVTGEFGALPFIAGTLITSLFALALAVPVSLGVAIFLSELSPDWLKQPLGTLIELLAAVPSVVYGLWALYVLVPEVVQPAAAWLAHNLGFIPLFAGPVYGPSRLAASVVLAIMITPTISAVSRDVFKAIPRGQREASLALGATQWETMWQVLLPYGLSGILGAVMLGLGRALGETMAVTMVIGNNLDLTASLLHPGYTMSSIIVNEFTEATYDLYLSALIEIGLVLFALTLVLNLGARFLVWSVGRQAPTEARV